MITSRGAASGAVVLAALLAWVSGIDGAFQFDDFNVIVDNPAVHTWAAWWASMPGIRPLLKASYTLNWTLGPGPLGFHLVNGAIHLVNALLVRRLVEALLERTGVATRHVQHSATASAILFAVHPAQTEVVTYVSGRSNALLATFMLLAVLAHVRAWAGSAPRRWRFLGALSFAAALAAKENAWVLPWIVVACERYAGGVSWWQSVKRSGALWGVLGLLVCVVFAVPRYWWLLGSSLGTRTLGENLRAQIDGVWYLVSRPLPGWILNIDPDVRLPEGASGLLAAKACVLLVCGLLAWRSGRDRPWVRLGLLWFVIALAATNSVLPRTDLANDRALYVPMIGLAWIVAAALVRLGDGRRSAIGLSGLVVALIVVTTLRNRDYRSEVALWTATVRHSPEKSRAWNNLGYALEREGRDDEAATAYRRSLALDPGNDTARTNLDLMQRAR